MITKQEFRKKWVTALRSNRYKQGTEGRLRSEDGKEHCCLGVLCEVYNEINPHAKTDIYSRVFPPYEVLSAIGMQNEAGSFDGKVAEFPPKIYKHSSRPEFTLSFLNDHGLSFNQIADVIEKHTEIFKD